MLTSKQRSYLRGLANSIDSIVQIGKEGVDDRVLAQIDEALEAREIIKLNVLKNSLLTAREACDIVCEELDADPVQVIGNKFVIYRQSKNKPKIELPMKK
ncbi:MULTISPECIES: ribosome assembly RNA-binding protein YhbY [Caloramator]|uniref:RNA-binding protein n=1 Tax=Caloramator proteoclasticus DSM 10124 TaxID=1121262 RepID=A0A1M4TJ80_9CLOT|nr:MULTISPECIES: ribosome assembly RNA-binding protein YhbY [Caloramator]SHE44486.1 RNA-binding protein [Caloramator proteoclasticus DSM 10124]